MEIDNPFNLENVPDTPLKKRLLAHQPRAEVTEHGQSFINAYYNCLADEIPEGYRTRLVYGMGVLAEDDCLDRDTACPRPSLEDLGREPDQDASVPVLTRDEIREFVIERLQDIELIEEPRDVNVRAYSRAAQAAIRAGEQHLGQNGENPTGRDQDGIEAPALELVHITRPWFTEFNGQDHVRQFALALIARIAVLVVDGEEIGTYRATQVVSMMIETTGSRGTFNLRVLVINYIKSNPWATIELSQALRDEVGQLEFNGMAHLARVTRYMAVGKMGYDFEGKDVMEATFRQICMWMVFVSLGHLTQALKNRSSDEGVRTLALLETKHAWATPPPEADDGAWMEALLGYIKHDQDIPDQEMKEVKEHVAIYQAWVACLTPGILGFMNPAYRRSRGRHMGIYKKLGAPIIVKAIAEFRLALLEDGTRYDDLCSVFRVIGETIIQDIAYGNHLPPGFEKFNLSGTKSLEDVRDRVALMYPEDRVAMGPAEEGVVEIVEMTA